MLVLDQKTLCGSCWLFINHRGGEPMVLRYSFAAVVSVLSVQYFVFLLLLPMPMPDPQCSRSLYTERKSFFEMTDLFRQKIRAQIY